MRGNEFYSIENEKQVCLKGAPDASYHCGIIIIAIINSKELIIMNKTELVKKVAAENDLTQKAAAAAVDSVLNSIMDSLAAREPVSLFGFGTFTCKHRDERTGRNPATGEAMTFAASNTPVLKPAKAFKEKVN